MRWHVELNEGGTSLHVEHLDDEDIALSTARELAAEAGGGHSRASEQQIERALGRLAEEGISEIEPGIDQTYDITDGVAVIVAGLDEGDTDDDCWKCAVT
jgi:hypothetical protein